MSIEFKGVSKSFGNFMVLDHVDFEIEKGEFVTLLGQSGTGKSVSLKLCMGMLKPDTGTIFVDGQLVDPANPQGLNIIRKRCGMVFQNPALFDSYTIYENIAYGIVFDPKDLYREVTRRKVYEALDEVHLPRKILKSKPQAVSFGMQKRVGIARTLACKPDYVLFDEPTTGLDPISSSMIHALIRELCNVHHVTSLVVSHDIQGALHYSDKIMVLNERKILANDSPEVLKKHTHPLIQSFIEEAAV